MKYFYCNGDSAISACDSYWNCKSKPKIDTKSNKPEKIRKIREFTYAELDMATNGFSAESFLGKGSHGSVYRGVLDDGKLIAAVKRNTFSNVSTNHQYHVSNCNNHCTNCNNPSENEIEILSRVCNRRIVNLLGFSIDCDVKKLLVVEFMPNGCLYDLLHTAVRPPGWTRRVRFALQVAKAVQVLHSSNPPVIHRDIKSSNVLIDEKWNARLGDFGLALRGNVEDVRIKCTPPAGTLGYLDPGYLAPGDLSTKSDIFSFGILLLEIVSGRNAIDVNYSPPSVVDWAIPLVKHGEYDRICDRRVGIPSDPAIARQLVVLAARCVRSPAEKRPEMSEVVDCLKVIRKKVQSPPVWNHLRRRARCVKNSPNLVAHQVFDESEEMIKSSKVGGRRNRKVSSVSGVELGSEMIGSMGDHVVRSKSTGSRNDDQIRLGRRKPNLAMKLPVVKLNKSRSMGVLQKRYVFETGKMTNSCEFDMSKLVISLEEKAERKMHEKPLVSY